MRNLVKLKVIILILSIFFAQKSIAADIILPLPKPIVDEKTEITATKKKYIYPQKKPEVSKEKAEIDIKDESLESFSESTEEVLIYPKKNQ